MLSSAVSGHEPAGDEREVTKNEVTEERDGMIPAESLLKVISQRRSHFPKDYDVEGDVPRAKIEMMLEAAKWAPTHGKTEPWGFVIMKKGSSAMQKFSELRASVSLRLKEEEEAKEGRALSAEERDGTMNRLKRKAKKLEKCAWIIAVIVRKVTNRKGNYMPDWEETAAVSSAVQNMHLLATTLDIGMYWSSGGWNSVLCDDEMKTFLHMKEGDRCLGILHVGAKTAKCDKYKAKRKSIQEVTTWL